MNQKAKESAQIKKYRRKLQKQLENEKTQMTEAALKKAKDSMQLWISRHQSERINLKDKTITLFDENRHPARTESKFVHDLFSRIRHDTNSALQPPQQEKTQKNKE